MRWLSVMRLRRGSHHCRLRMNHRRRGQDGSGSGFLNLGGRLSAAACAAWAVGALCSSFDFSAAGALSSVRVAWTAGAASTGTGAGGSFSRTVSSRAAGGRSSMVSACSARAACLGTVSVGFAPLESESAVFAERNANRGSLRTSGMGAGAGGAITTVGEVGALSIVLAGADFC